VGVKIFFGHKGTKGQRHKGTKAQRHRVTEAQRADIGVMEYWSVGFLGRSVNDCIICFSKTFLTGYL